MILCASNVLCNIIDYLCCNKDTVNVNWWSYAGNSETVYIRKKFKLPVLLPSIELFYMNHRLLVRTLSFVTVYPPYLTTGFKIVKVIIIIILLFYVYLYILEEIGCNSFLNLFNTFLNSSTEISLYTSKSDLIVRWEAT